MQLFNRSFYNNSAEAVARQLLGHFILRKIDGQWVGGIIAETEAYIENDPACHAYIGGKTLHTPRVKVLWEEPGHAYVYVIYGIYHCFNITCLPKGRAEAILVRAIIPTHGLEIMQQLRPVKKENQLTSGPGKLCKAMDIDRTHDGLDLCDINSPIIIAKNPDLETTIKEQGPVIAGPRIGINVSSKDWPLRFGLGKSTFLSRKF